VPQSKQKLQKWRKNRPKKPEGLASKSQLGAMKEISTNSEALTSSLEPQALALIENGHGTPMLTEV